MLAGRGKRYYAPSRGISLFAVSQTRTLFPSVLSHPPVHFLLRLFPSVAEFVQPAVNQCRLSTNPNAVKSLWKIMKPVIIDVNFVHRLKDCDTTGDDDDTLQHCQAAAFTLLQVDGRRHFVGRFAVFLAAAKDVCLEIYTSEPCHSLALSLIVRSCKVSPLEAKRSSKVIALMRHWVELQLLIHQQALEYRRTHELPKGVRLNLGRKSRA